MSGAVQMSLVWDWSSACCGREQVTEFPWAAASCTDEGTTSPHSPRRAGGLRWTGDSASPVPGTLDDLEGDAAHPCAEGPGSGQGSGAWGHLGGNWMEGKAWCLSALGPAASGLSAETTGAYFKGDLVRHQPLQSHVPAQVTKVTQRKDESTDATVAGHSVAVPQGRPGQGHTFTWCRLGTWALGSNLRVSGGASTSSLRRRYRTQARTRGAGGQLPSSRWPSPGPRGSWETAWDSGVPKQPNREA